MSTTTVTCTTQTPSIDNPVCKDGKYGHLWTFVAADGVHYYLCRRCRADISVSKFRGMTIFSQKSG